MRLAVASTGPDLDSPLDGRFGRCAWFVLVDSETLAFEALANASAERPSGAGIQAAQSVAEAGAEVVVASQFGPNAYTALTAGGLELREAVAGTVRDNVRAYTEGTLVRVEGASAAPHAGMTPGAGRGRGGGHRGGGRR